MQNPKYANVKSTINTGASAKNVNIQSTSHSIQFIIVSAGSHSSGLKLICVVIGDQLIAKRRNERFKRIKCSTLARLLRESLAEESIYQLNRDGPISGDVQASDSVSQRGAQQPMMAA